MLSKIIRLSRASTRGFLYRNSSFEVNRSAKEEEKIGTQIIDVIKEKEIRYLDLRYKNPSIENPEKVDITGKEIEKSILYNSLVDSFVDKSPFMKRVIKCSKFELNNRRREKKELMDKHVDSVIVAKLSSSSPPISGNREAEECSEEISNNINQFPFSSFTPINKKYLRFEEEQLNEQMILSDEFDYGTADPSIPISQIPCGGCGALLHCQSTSVPGYLPSEVFAGNSRHQLRGKICQRCRFLREHNVALSVQISPEDYPKVLSVIQNKIAMVILVVDLLDFPGSIWPGLMDIIGTKRPVLVVGNKVDLLPKDSPGYLQNIEKSLVRCLETNLKRANVKDVCLASATTGYGIEQLITKIQNLWGFQGDAYLMGCTNVGKSSLFNALIQSDLCKTQAIDILERATVSLWPGTTLNLLKFPMLRPTSIRLSHRVQRLKAEARTRQAQDQLRRLQLKETNEPKYATLIGHIGRTFEVQKDGTEKLDPFAVRAEKVPGESNNFFNPNNKQFKDSKWCFDTPGTVNHDQILSLLTLEELMLTVPNKLVQPRTILFRPGTSYFLGGLARIDYLQGPHPLLYYSFVYFFRRFCEN